MMAVGFPVQNTSTDSMKCVVESLISTNSVDSGVDSLEGDLIGVQDISRILDLNDEKTTDSNVGTNNDNLDHNISCISSSGSNEIKSNKSITVVSMKKLLEGVNSTKCVELPYRENSNGLKIPRIREERIKLIRDLLEFYMSDSYRLKDLFFLKRTKGWVSIKFLLSFKRLKRSAKDIDELKEAIKISQLFEINKEETKVKLLNVLPDCTRDYIPCKIAIIGGLPENFKNLNEASKLLGLYGDVVSLQLLRPGGAIPEILQTVQDIPEIGTQWCIVVEYDEMHSAGELVSYINEESDINVPAWAVELVISLREGPSRKSRTCGQSDSQGSSTSMTSLSSTIPQTSSTQSTPSNSPCVKEKKNIHGQTKKEVIVTSIDGDQALSSNDDIFNKIGQQQTKKSNNIQNFKSNYGRNPPVPHITDDNWSRRKHVQNLKSSSTHPSAEEKLKRNNHLKNLKTLGKQHSEPCSSDTWRLAPINAGSIDEEEVYSKTNTKSLAPAKAASIEVLQI